MQFSLAAVHVQMTWRQYYWQRFLASLDAKEWEMALRLAQTLQMELENRRAAIEDPYQRSPDANADYPNATGCGPVGLVVATAYPPADRPNLVVPVQQVY